MKSITVQELKKHVDEGMHNSIIVDVRNPEEVAGGMFPNATNIPLNTLSEHVDVLREYDSVYVNCMMGGRSSQACTILSEKGIPVTNIEGGFAAWKEAGYAA
jgi:rhodanese-related sulfurtransferase